MKMDCIVSIEDNELAMEEGGSINDLIDDTQQYIHFVRVILCKVVRRNLNEENK